MDFRVGDEQRELAEGIRALVAGRLPIGHLRAQEGAERTIGADDWAALGETGVFALTLPVPAWAWPTPPSSSRSSAAPSSRALWSARSSPPRSTWFPAPPRVASWSTRARVAARRGWWST